MVQKQTMLEVADNSGAKKLMVIHVSGSTGKRFARLGDTVKVIRETVRVLKKGGKVFILEFSPVQSGLTGWFYKNYLKFIVPVLGGYISGDNNAYRYLAASIPDFLEPEKVLQLMKAQGYMNIKATALTNGIAYIYEGTK